LIVKLKSIIAMRDCKFKYVYDFAKVISDMVEADSYPWVYFYDEQRFIEASLKPNRISLLYNFIYCQLLAIVR